jgi:hypothetical protein
VHWPSRIEEHAWGWLTPYGPAEPAPEAPGQTLTDSWPVVYGYVRSAQQGHALLGRWKRELRSFCQQAGLRLVHCFCSMGRHQISDIGECGPSLVRPYVLGAEAGDTDPTRPNTVATAQAAPALRVLLTILEQRPVYGVVVPSIFHFATERRAAMALIHHIERLGTKVMVVPANRTPSEPNRPASNGYRNGSHA